jgi:hypothetical protein
VRHKPMPNKVTGANSRPASPLEAGRQFGRSSCALPFLSAAVAQFGRWAATVSTSARARRGWRCTLLRSHRESLATVSGHEGPLAS